MIAQITGLVSQSEIGYLVLDVHGVGYKVYVPISVTGKVGEEMCLHTHMAVRENAIDLYGFADLETLRFFELLLRVSGIGPKSALNIISISPIENLKQAIGEGDYSYLTKVSGIGRKTAEKIVLELRDKISFINSSGSSTGSAGNVGILRAESDALEALISLGYNRKESQDALREAKVGNASERLKLALKTLGKNNN